MSARDPQLRTPSAIEEHAGSAHRREPHGTVSRALDTSAKLCPVPAHC
jgi:hypothetical protein